jgi:hypothetical protein
MNYCRKQHLIDESISRTYKDAVEHIKAAVELMKAAVGLMKVAEEQKNEWCS